MLAQSPHFFVVKRGGCTHMRANASRTGARFSNRQTPGCLVHEFRRQRGASWYPSQLRGGEKKLTVITGFFACPIWGERIFETLGRDPRLIAIELGPHAYLISWQQLSLREPPSSLVRIPYTDAAVARLSSVQRTIMVKQLMKKGFQRAKGAAYKLTRARLHQPSPKSCPDQQFNPIPVH